MNKQVMNKQANIEREEKSIEQHHKLATKVQIKPLACL
jgi:hypothetical protein